MGSRMFFPCSAQKFFHLCCVSPDVRVLKWATSSVWEGKPARAAARCGECSVLVRSYWLPRGGGDRLQRSGRSRRQWRCGEALVLGGLG